jgi:hypothetical protein
MPDWEPVREPLRVTLTRTLGIAIVIGAVVALSTGRLRSWPAITLLALWPSVGGHWVELAFLNYLRPRISESRHVQLGARILVWFIGGIILVVGMRLTAMLLPARPRIGWITWTIAGVAFIAIELIAHAGLHLRGRASVYNGMG